MRRSGRWRLPASVGHAYRAVEGGEVGGPVRCDRRAVRQQFPGVFEHHDAVTEQAPALLGVADYGVRRFAVRSRRGRTRRRVWAHISASWLFHHACSRLVFSVPQVVRLLTWPKLIVFPAAICSFPLVTYWHFLTTSCHISF
jgi:hypothetical protein